MGLNITTTYPAWFLLFCIATGILFAFILYYKNPKTEFSVTLNVVLAILRAIFITIISFLLLNPLVNTQRKFTEKPVILVLQDNSSSIAMGKDSTFIRSEYPEAFSGMKEKLSDEYDVEAFDFSDRLSPGNSMTFDGQVTNLSQVFDEVKNRYAYRNIGAMVLASDGIYNRGSNPVSAAEGLQYPIYTIALGDTSIARDVILKKVSFNRVAYLGNEFPMEITIHAGKSKSLSTRLTISKDDKPLYSEVIPITAENFITTRKVLLQAAEKGLNRFTIDLAPVEGEISKANNRQDVFIDILEGKQKILLLSQAPHPDISALKQAILSNKNYEFEEYNIDQFDKNVNGYNLVILHGLPSLKNNISNILEELKNQKIPVWYILTKTIYYPLFNDQLAGVSVRGENLIYNEVQPTLNPDFTMFSVGEATQHLLKEVPPVVSPYGAIGMQPSSSPMLYQKIGSVETQEPLLVLNESGDMKTGVFLGEGIWRWRLKSWALSESHEPFDQLINKVVQFLSLKVDKRFFRIIHDNNFEENENVEFEAQVYNEIYELINDPEVKIVFTDGEGNEFPYVFNKTANAYHLNAGRLPAGSYRYSASVQLGDKLLTDQGEFTVSPLNIELTNAVADHNMLYNLAQSRGGEMFYPGQMQQLEDAVLSRDDIKTITYRQNQFSEVLNLFWLLIMIILMISVEWFVRKRAGGY